jgi:hypothetical protein
MVRSFITGGIMAILFIFLFSFVGIFGAMEAVLNPGRCVGVLHAIMHSYGHT